MIISKLSLLEQHDKEHLNGHRNKLKVKFQVRVFLSEPEFNMVVHRLLSENESVHVVSQANALPPLKGKDVTSSGLPPLL